MALASVALAAVTASTISVRATGMTQTFLWVNQVFDVVFASVLCYLTGASHSFGQLVFLCAIFAGAWLGGRSAAMVTAGLSAIGFACALILSEGLPSEAAARLTLYTEGMFRIFAFLLLGGLAGTLVESLRREQRSSARLGVLHEAVLERLSAAVITVDTSGRITGGNPAAGEMLGRVQGDLLSRVLPGAVPSGTWAESPSAGQRWVCSAGQLPEGGSVVVIEDVTALERERQRREDAERLAVAGHFAAGLAHEVRNPLSSVLGCLQMLSADNPNRLTRLAIAEAERLNRLLDDFLLLSRPPSMTFERVNLLGLARQVAETFAADQRYGHKVAVALTGEDVAARVDPDRLRQALWNLLLNGAQAMPEGGRVAIAVGQEGFVDGEPSARLLVEDNGVGIPREHIHRIFDPGFTRRAGGTGIGLALVKQLIELHGGTIDVALPATGGTSFAIHLPLDGPRGR